MHKIVTLLLPVLLLAGAEPVQSQVDDQAMPFQVEQGQPESTEFLGSYPNPVRNKSYFKFQLAQSQEVGIYLYDLLGNQKRSIEKRPYKAGVHTVKMDLSGMKAGVYFYKVHIKERTLTERLNIVD